MLLREGTIRGNEPTVQMLEICRNQSRKQDDLVPYLPAFAKYFRPLPQNEKAMLLRSALIPLSDIECITKTVIDIPERVQNINYRKRTSAHYISQ
jgi:antiviral helicase SKI2